MAIDPVVDEADTLTLKAERRHVLRHLPAQNPLVAGLFERFRAYL